MTTPPDGTPAGEAAYRFMLQLAPGTGIVSRRDGAVLFFPQPTEGVEKVLAAFVAAPAGRELDAVADAVVDNDFAVPPFACVAADDQVTLRVFGQVEIRTDQRAAPRLRGHGADTWIDHRLHGRPESAEIAVNDAGLDELTDLVAGTVHAGGFNLLVTRTGSDVGRLAGPGAPGDPAATRDPQAGQATSPIDPELLEHLLEVFEAARSTDPRTDAPPPTAEPITAGPTTAGPTTAGPAKGLLFDDGERYGPVGDLVIGRNPDRIAEALGVEPYVVQGERVSRAHLLIRVRGPQLLVEDHGSRNGTVVVPAEGHPPVPLEPGKPATLETGATVYFGAKSFTVVDLDG